MTRLWQAFPDEFVLNFSYRVIDVEKKDGAQGYLTIFWCKSLIKASRQLVGM
jgi:hypothetical protein